MATGVGISLKSIVDSYLIEEGRDSKHKYLSYLHLAIDGLRELNWDVNGATKMETLVPDGQGVINLPEDFVKEVRIASVASDGTLVTLGRNDDIFKGMDGCGNYSGNNQTNYVETPTTSGFTWNSTIEHYNKGQNIGRYYGIGGRSTAGEYKINRERGEIWLDDGVDATQLILEYIGYMPERIGGQFIVHPFLKEPLMNWIQYASKRRFASPAEVDFLHRKYIASKNWARQRFWNMDYTEVLEIARKNFTQAPRS